MASGSDTLANVLLQSLIAGKSFTFPTVDLSDDMFDQPSNPDLEIPVTKLTNEHLTTGSPGGTGTFDLLMKSIKAHLKEEYDGGRIAGAEYSKTYMALVPAALQAATQFLLGRDQAYYGSVMAQQQAQQAAIEKVTARITLEGVKVKLAQTQYEAATAEAGYALTKIKLATEDATFGNLLTQGEILAVQKLGVEHDNTGKVYTNTNILPLQKDLLQEQANVQRAQTLDTRFDGATVIGLVGKQKDLYTQQITSYKRDSELKVTKIYADAYITQKTIDEGTTPPLEFTASAINNVLTTARQKVELG